MSLNVLAMAKAEKQKAKAKEQPPGKALECGSFALNDGTTIPMFGLGCYRSAPGAEAYDSVLMALRQGYRLIDTAELYANEADVGKAIRDSGIPRDQIYVTTKFWPCNGHGYERVLNAFQSSLQKLGLDYIDLYLVHSPADQHKRADTWRAMEHLKQTNKVRSIGVSNYGAHHIEELLKTCTIPPSVNQIEISPFNTRVEIVAKCKEHNICVEAYSPLTKGRRLGDAVLVQIAKQHSKTAAQVLIRWCLDKNYVVIPKSVKEERLLENANVFDFALSEDDIAKLDALHEGLVTGWDPTKDP